MSAQKKGNKLNRINDYYRRNASNQLIGISTHRGEVWYYKYDGLGRRIAKECPQRDLKIEYVWDGDQLAYTQTFKNDELQSRRHCVFNGWQLLAQQDWYSELEQNHNGNIVHQRAETSYAITQPNGKVLALFNPQGRKVWAEEPKSIWGLRLNSLFSYAKPSPFNPQMLFAGQWLDEESGLAYNRFRYYDPTTANYLCADPIGLHGGGLLFFYVQNPWDWIDPFGLAGCPVSKYEVGIFDDLQRRSVVGDKLDIHHVAQKHHAGQIIPGYDPSKAPSIAIPRIEHARIPTIKGEYIGSARDLLAKDIRDLRKYTNAPNSAIRELIALNKSMYPSAFTK